MFEWYPGLPINLHRFCWCIKTISLEITIFLMWMTVPIYLRESSHLIYNRRCIRTKSAYLIRFFHNSTDSKRTQAHISQETLEGTSYEAGVDAHGDIEDEDVEQIPKPRCRFIDMRAQIILYPPQTYLWGVYWNQLVRTCVRPSDALSCPVHYIRTD